VRQEEEEEEVIRRLSLLAGMVISLAAPNTALAADFFVDQETGSESNDCSTPALACQTIQRGVTLATNEGVDQVLHVDDSPTAYVTGSVTLFKGISLIADNTVAGTATESPTGKPIIQTDGASGQALFVQASGGGSPGTTIRGFTFRPNDRTSIVAAGPFTSLENNDFEGPASPTISDDDQGVVLAATSPTVSGNTFTNLRFGVTQSNTGSPILTGNEFAGTHHGNAIEIELGSPTLIANLIHVPGASTTQAVRIGVGGPTNAVSATFLRNRILGGSSFGVNLEEVAGPISFDGDLIAGANISGIALGDGDSNGDSDVTATNVTVVSDPGATSEISLSGTAQLTLDSSIIGDASISAPASASCLISFTRGPLALATANGCHTFQTRLDPLFVDPDGGDFHLQEASTMVDAGNPGVPPGGILDLDGDARALDGNCDGTPQRDIGADELVKSCPPPPSSTGTGPTPAAPTTPKRKKCKKAKKRAVSSKKKCKKRK
jgi:hypothetical protein